MDKKLKNELFKVAVDYLFREKKVGSKKELAERIGITAIPIPRDERRPHCLRPDSSQDE